MKRSRVTSLLGVVNLGLAIISWFLSANFTIGLRCIDFTIFLSVMLIILAIICAYFEIHSSSIERIEDINLYNKGYRRNCTPTQPMGRVLSIFYGVVFLAISPAIGALMLIFPITSLTIGILIEIIWISIAVIGFVAAIVYRDDKKKEKKRINKLPNIPNQFFHEPFLPKSKPKTKFIESKINEYITLKLENGRTFIYVNGKRFLQCIRLILNIPKKDVRLYDEIESIDEAADMYNTHLFQNRIITGPMARPVLDQSHNITPEQEFWGHCSNIQAWVEHGYDTRILKSNVSFPLLRELAQAGDPVARKVFKDEIALRLESGYPSVVQYLLNQGYIKYLTPFEFKTVLDTTKLIENLSSEPRTLFRFLQSCVIKFPNLVKDILAKILMLPNGKKVLSSSISVNLGKTQFRSYPIFLITLYQALDDLLGQSDLQQDEDIIECILKIEETIETWSSLPPLPNNYQDFLKNKLFDNLMLEGIAPFEYKMDNLLLQRLRHLHTKCSYCGKIIPKGSNTCYWCGHKKDDDEGGFFPYPYNFKPPGGPGGVAKRKIAVPVYPEPKEEL